MCHDPAAEVRAEIARTTAEALTALAPAGTPLVAAVSGGADSVALACALGELGARWPLRAVVFVDHGLRDVAAEQDAANAAAARAGVSFITRPVELAGKNLQAAARKARYQALIAAARAIDPAALVATGHTRSDQAETVLSRLLRGAGLPGLAGLAPRKGRVVRPLLAVSRRLTRAAGLPFHDDPSNASARFERNRLRARLEGFGPDQDALELALARLAETARGASQLLDAVGLAAPAPSFTGWDEAATRTLLVHLARAQGARGLDRRSLTHLAGALRAGGLTAVSLGAGLRGMSERGRLRLGREEDPRRTVVAWRPGTYRASAMTMHITPRTGDDGDAREGAAFVPLAALQWPLKLEPAPADAPGAFGDEVDFVSGAPLGGWRVLDGSGRTLVPAVDLASPVAVRSPGAPAPSREEHGIEIVLEPFTGARDTRVVGDSQGPLNKG